MKKQKSQKLRIETLNLLHWELCSWKFFEPKQQQLVTLYNYSLENKKKLLYAYYHVFFFLFVFCLYYLVKVLKNIFHFLELRRNIYHCWKSKSFSYWSLFKKVRKMEGRKGKLNFLYVFNFSLFMHLEIKYITLIIINF